MKKISVLFVLMCHISLTLGAVNDYQNSIVKVFSAKQDYDYSEPWKRLPVKNGYATGFIIPGGRVLTNAHAVANSRFIQVRFEGKAEKVPVEVEYLSDDYDLAILSFREDFDRQWLVPLEFGEMPKVQDHVTVYGYPVGGDGLSITEGIISRVEAHKYVFSQQEFTVLQTDAAINPGNSGGPVVKDGLVVGVAFQGRRGSNNIGYIIPSHIVKHFIQDVADGEYDGIPDFGIQWSNLESPVHRKMLGLSAEQSGILVKNVFAYSCLKDVIQRGDVLTAINEYTIDIDGTITFRDRDRVNYRYLLENTNFEDELRLSYVRNQEEHEVTVSIANCDNKSVIAKYRSTASPRYYVKSGIVFEKLSINYLNKFSKSFINRSDTPYELLSLMENPPTDVEEIVFIVSVLPDDSNMGYQEIKNLRIEEINNEKVINFQQFVEELDRGNYVELIGSEGQVIIIDNALSKERDALILERYNIPRKSSEE